MVEDRKEGGGITVRFVSDDDGETPGARVYDSQE